MAQKDIVKENTYKLLKTVEKDMKKHIDILLEEIDYDKEGRIARLPQDIMCAIAKNIEYIYQPARSAKENQRRIERLYNVL